MGGKAHAEGKRGEEEVIADRGSKLILDLGTRLDRFARSNAALIKRDSAAVSI